MGEGMKNRGRKPNGSGKGRKNPIYVSSDGKIDPTLASSLIDVTLGTMFVEALKKTGLREGVLKALFPKEDGPHSGT
jgi:hypothetical protein